MSADNKRGGWFTTKELVCWSRHNFIIFDRVELAQSGEHFICPKYSRICSVVYF